MRKVLFLFIIICSVNISLAQSVVDSVLTELDKVIMRSDVYENEKKARIDIVYKDANHQGLVPESRFEANRRLYAEYEYYNSDSAIYYVNKTFDIATEINRQDWINMSLVYKARSLSVAGLYSEAIELIRTVDKSKFTPNQLVEYYKTIENTYVYHSEYAQDERYCPAYMLKAEAYRDSAMAQMRKGTFWHTTSEAQGMIRAGYYTNAIEFLSAHLKDYRPDTREYAVIVSSLAYAYELNGEPEKRMICLAQSAMADIQGVVKENTALRQLAEMLYAKGDVERANRYLKKSLQDANEFNARMRNIQSSKMLPLIDASYQAIVDKQNQRLKIVLSIVGVLSLFLLIAVLYIFRQMKQLKRTSDKLINVNAELKRLNEELTMVNAKQKETNTSLTEANVIKEEYIGRFLQLCSTYISEMEAYRKMLSRKAATGRADEVFKAIKSTQFIDDSLREFYQSFDTSFLNIFPTFVDRFNELLSEDERIVLKQDERLNTELRIFALIRLGITDSQKIASFLRCSITTIYTYRSKLKNRSLHKDNFEAQVMKISSF